MRKTKLFQKKILINGKLIDARLAGVSVFDRGFMYGDGVFESLRTYNGKPFLLNEHLERLFTATKKLKIEIPNPKSQIPTRINTLLKINKLKEAYIKIIVTRGIATKHGLSMKNTAGKPTIIIITEKITTPKTAVATKIRRSPTRVLPHPWKIITVKTSRVQSPGTPAISTIKSLNYLENILAKAEAERRGADEAIFLDNGGNILEGTVSNIFMAKNGVLATPPLSLPILPGVTRAFIIKLARRLKIKVIEKKISLPDLYAADECFLTFSGVGIVPVSKINFRKKIIGLKSGNVKSSRSSKNQTETKAQSFAAKLQLALLRVAQPSS